VLDRTSHVNAETALCVGRVVNGINNIGRLLG